MLRDFHTGKIIFGILNNSDTFIEDATVKLYLNYDHSLPLGRVRLFRKGDKIYGRIKYYVNLEAYKKAVKNIGPKYPSLRIESDGTGFHEVTAYLSDDERREDVKPIGQQLLRRRLTACGLLVMREHEHLISKIRSKPSDDKFVSAVYAAQVTPDHMLTAEILIDSKSGVPVAIKYVNLHGQTELFYLDKL